MCVSRGHYHSTNDCGTNYVFAPKIISSSSSLIGGGYTLMVLCGVCITECNFCM